MDLHRERERKNQDELERVHERNFESSKLMRQILVAYFWWNLYMHQIFDAWNFIERIKACVHYFCFCHQNETLKKSSKWFYQKSSFYV